MKKKIISIIIASALFLSVFSGCQLITVNTQRNMMQVVATVTTTDKVDGKDITFSDKIYKRDLVSMFNSTGYYYVYYYSYTYEQAYELIMDSLVERKIMLHEAKRDYLSMVSDNKINDIDQYLVEWEKSYAKYLVDKSVNDLLDNFEKDVIANLSANSDEEEDEDETFLEWDGYKETLRTVPTKADEEDEAPEVTDQASWEDAKDSDGNYYKDYKLNLNKASDLDDSTDETRKKAYNKMVKAIDYYNLFTESFTEFTDSDFYKDELKSQMEQQLLNKFIKSITDKVALENSDGSDDAAIEITYSDIQKIYTEKYENQKTTYKNSSTDYKSALEALTEDGYLLFNPYEDFGFVYNILIPFDTIQSYKLKYLQNTTYQDDDELSGTDKYRLARKNLLKDVKGKDLRASWITNEYDFDMDTKLFGEKMYTNVSDTYKGFAFQGSVYNSESENIPEGITIPKDKFYIQPEESTFEQIFDKFITLLGGDAAVSYKNPDNLGPDDWVDVDKTAQNSAFYAANSKEIVLYRGVVTDNSADLDALRGMVNDFMFAYSTDPGSLNTYKGYLYPGSSTFVAEFTEACKEVIKLGEGAFSVVGTDYGWHIIYCTKTIVKTADDGYVAEYELKQSELNDKDSFTYKFADGIVEAMKNDYYEEARLNIVNKYKTDDNVIKYPKRYKDLILD